MYLFLNWYTHKYIYIEFIIFMNSNIPPAQFDGEKRSSKSKE